jgi:6-phospho-3-hexuloisomerase
VKDYRRLVLDEVRQVLERVSARDADRFVAALARARRIYITGVGRSGLVVKAFGQRLMHLGIVVHLADEITAPAISRGDVLVACSGTGTTQLTLYLARKARAIGARVLALTARPRSPLARLARHVVEIPAPLERGRRARGVRTRQPARSLFEQALFLFLDAVVLKLIETLGVGPRKIERRHANLE